MTITASDAIASPAYLARRFRIRIIFRAWVAANVKNGIERRSPSARCSRSIAMKNDEYFVKERR